MSETERLEKLAKEHDENWDKVMQLAKENGFIIEAFAGTAVLVCNDDQIKSFGYEKYKKIQETNNALNKMEEA